ncbi:MAG: hypothetical protein PHX27_00110 [Candidatus ainarchaeum sp.]|nr:hypothetical protein [Candidatus ainarchaeum sp.]
MVFEKKMSVKDLIEQMRKELKNEKNKPVETITPTKKTAKATVKKKTAKATVKKKTIVKKKTAKATVKKKTIKTKKKK